MPTSYYVTKFQIIYSSFVPLSSGHESWWLDNCQYGRNSHDACYYYYSYSYFLFVKFEMKQCAFRYTDSLSLTYVNKYCMYHWQLRTLNQNSFWMFYFCIPFIVLTEVVVFISLLHCPMYSSGFNHEWTI